MSGRIIFWPPDRDLVPNGGIDESVAPQALPPEKWTAGADVEPLPDGVRTRSGSTAQNSTALQPVGITYNGGTDNREFVNGTSEYIATNFTTVGAIAVSRVAVRIGKITDPTGSPAGNDLTCYITTTSSSEPDTVVTGLDQADFSSLDKTTITDEFVWYYFTVAAAVTLSAATEYAIVIRDRDATATATDTIDIQEDTAGGGGASGGVWTSTNGGTWVDQTPATANFRIYTSGGNAAVTAIADYRLSDSSTSRHLVYANLELYKNVGGTMTAVSARQRAGMTVSADLFPSWAVGQDRFFLTNNTETPKKFYVKSSTEYWEDEGLAAPTTTPTFTPTAGNALPDGLYYVDYHYWNDDIGVRSNSRFLGTIGTSNDATTSSEHIAITGLPATTVNENERATHIRIMLREVDSSVFRLAKEIAIGTTSTTIGASDLPTTVEDEYNHNAPPVHEIKCVAENRQFIANVVDPTDSTRKSYRVMFSAINGTTPYYESYPATNFRDFGQGDGDWVTAMFFMPPRTLIVGMKNSLWALDARRPKTSDRINISREVGIAHHNAGVVVGDSLFFFSNSSQRLGPYVWRPGQNEPQLIRGLDDTIKALEDSRLKYASCGSYAPGDERYQWWTLLTSASGTQGDRIIMYDYALKAWSVYRRPSGKEINVLGVVESSGIDRVFAGNYAGVEFQLDSGTTDDGTSFKSSFTLGINGYSAPQMKKRHRRVKYAALRKSAGSMQLVTKRDYGNRSDVTTVLPHSQGGGTSLVWGTGAWGATIWGPATDIRGTEPHRGTAETFQHTIGSDNPFHLKGIQFGVQPTRRV